MATICKCYDTCIKKSEEHPWTTSKIFRPFPTCPSAAPNSKAAQARQLNTTEKYQCNLHCGCRGYLLVFTWTSVTARTCLVLVSSHTDTPSMLTLHSYFFGKKQYLPRALKTPRMPAAVDLPSRLYAAVGCFPAAIEPPIPIVEYVRDITAARRLTRLKLLKSGHCKRL